MGNIQRNLKDKTLIFIEHRLNMIENVEEIWEFKNHTLKKMTESSKKLQHAEKNVLSKRSKNVKVAK
jgi:ABC-type transport system involved in cytochrome bd biosynthesis fused ATPase/permease subunit